MPYSRTLLACYLILIRTQSGIDSLSPGAYRIITLINIHHFFSGSHITHLCHIQALQKPVIKERNAIYLQYEQYLFMLTEYNL
jgi:hypothetical protein